ncbi:MAG TPA: hypothetical protein VE136_10655 [Anaerolineales bacterium]|nr:hypothetical protein [Anaerolineales bacterium]
MGEFSGQVTKVQLEAGGSVGAWIACPTGAIPQPGQYVLAADHEAVLATPVFASDSTSDGFLAAPPVPKSWGPGSSLQMRGPLGHGFSLPEAGKRLALVAVGNSVSRLMQIAVWLLRKDAEIALFTDAPPGPLPNAIEVNPLQMLPDALTWPDFLVLDLPLETMPDLRQIFGLTQGGRLPCPAQALIFSPMPCGNLADCGACALRGRRSWKLACKDGPVFNLNELEW